MPKRARRKSKTARAPKRKRTEKRDKEYKRFIDETTEDEEEEEEDSLCSPLFPFPRVPVAAPSSTSVPVIEGEESVTEESDEEKGKEDRSGIKEMAGERVDERDAATQATETTTTTAAAAAAATTAKATKTTTKAASKTASKTKAKAKTKTVTSAANATSTNGSTAKKRSNEASANIVASDESAAVEHSSPSPVASQESQKPAPKPVKAKKTTSDFVLLFEKEMLRFIGSDGEPDPKDFNSFISCVLPVVTKKMRTERCDREIAVFGRKLRLFQVSEELWRNKVMTKYLVIEPHIAYYVIDINNESPEELFFLRSMADKLQSSSENGCPILLCDEGTRVDLASFNYYISDCGFPLDSCMNRIGSDLVCLAIVSLIASLPVSNRDVDLNNFGVLLPNTQFRYIWTLRIGKKLFELSWISHGIVTFMDWGSCEHINVTGDGKHSLSAIFIPDTPLTKAVSGAFFGQSGLYCLLFKILSFVEQSRVQIAACLDNPSGNSKSNSSTLEMEPVICFDDTVKLPADFSQKMTASMAHFGNLLYTNTKTSEDYHEVFTSLSRQMVTLSNKDFFDIPSDSGLVVLRKDLTLVAAVDIAARTLVTRIPCINQADVIGAERFSIVLDGVEVVPMKKPIPFAGFGSFATAGSVVDVNCEIKKIGSEICLYSTRKISYGDEIVFSSVHSRAINRVVTRSYKTICGIIEKELNKIGLQISRCTK